MKKLALLLPLLLLAAPERAHAQCDDSDNDNDTFSCAAGDCNDFNNTVFPGAPELCDGLDNNCDMTPDNPPDGDGDGVNLCQGDCDDADPDRFPGNPEVCDGIDNDCSGATQDATISRPCYTGPAGTNGQGVCHGGTELCNGPTGWSGTCANEVTPSPETCGPEDLDCNGNPYNGFPDGDGDGHTTCTDCDDGNPNRYPGNTEVCDGADNDCNAGTLDTALTQSCYTGPAGTNNRGICHGGTRTCNGTTFTGQPCVGEQTPLPETCGPEDRDCDGNPNNGFNADNDPVAVCDGDCDDNNPNRYPGNTEVCDGVDNDCNPATLDTTLTQSCYTGPAGTNNRGICHGGTRTCNGTTFTGQPCVGEQTPLPETCGPEDLDCDNNPNNGFNADNDPVAICDGDCDDNNPNVYPGRAETCDGIDNNCNMLIDETFDNDGDGYTTCGGDCDDNDFNQYPGAPEACNGEDDDCDTMIDEGFTDADMDGYVNCGPNADCDDMNNVRFPGNPEVCDGFDNDCDVLVDERNAAGAPLRRGCYTGPAGTNGIGTCHGGQQECIGGTFTGNPCLNEVVPIAELCNQQNDDCDNATDEDFDLDMDGFTTCAPTPDCDDNNNARFPGATEVCNGVDDDCDTRTDENNQNQPLTMPCYTGPMNTQGVGLCQGGHLECLGAAGFGTTCIDQVVPAMDDPCDGDDNDCDGETDEGFDVDMDGVTSCGGDCNDNDATIRPGALDICNNVDDDCDTTIDGNETPCYTGPVGTATVGLCHPGTAVCINGQPGACADEQTPVAEVCDGEDNDCDGVDDNGFDLDGDGVSSCNGDCDDNNPFAAAGQEERCDCQDNNCNIEIDEDGFGGSVCEQGACHDFDTDGFTNCDGDCHDRDPATYPGAPEICGDQRDNDCDGAVDEDVDEDGDGVTTCGGDCDDRFAAINSFAIETCDGFDNNCDGNIDEGFDVDSDFATTCAGDCDDNDPNRSPFRREVCGNGVDDDCDGFTDPDVDNDGDGFATCDGDCNDYNAVVYPGAPEICDGQDNDCNNRVDEGFDNDNDRFATCFGDCDDNDPNIGPFAREVVNNVDDNCNGAIDEGQEDNDADGFSFLCGDCDDTDPGVSPHATDTCDRRDNDCDGRVDRTPAGTSSCMACNDIDGDGVTDCDGDCNDLEPAIRPSATEVCNGADDDCDGTTDVDRATGASLCVVAMDAGPMTPDSGPPPPPDAGEVAPDAGTIGPEPLANAAAVAVTCGCNAAPSRAPAGGVVLALLGVLVLARRRRSWLALLLLALAAAPACTRFEVGGAGADGASDGGSSDTGPAAPDAEPDAGPGPDASGLDREPPDYGSLTVGPCRFEGPQQIELVDLPSRKHAVALHRESVPTFAPALDAILFDDESKSLRGFILRTPLDPAIDPEDPRAATLVIDQLVDPLFSQPLPGVTGIAARVDESLKQSIVRDGRPAARTLRAVEMVNDVAPSQVRTGFLARLAKVTLADIPPVPMMMAEAPARTLSFGTYVEIDPLSSEVTIILALGDRTQDELISTRIADLTNTTHLGPSGASLGIDCENKTATALRVDFIWVVDNSASMQQEQRALALTADQFFGALQRSRIDYRIGVVATDGEALRGGGFTTDLDEFRTRVQVGINGNGREQGLEYGVRAVERAATATIAAERLRTDAVPVVIFFSDEDAANLRTIDEYVAAFEARNVLAFAIVGPRPRGCSAIGRGIARVGENYIRIAEALGGTSASICANDLTQPIEEILIAAAGAASLTTLMNVPISGSLQVALETSTVARSRTDGFDYEPTSNSVLFFGDSAPPVASTYRVTYTKFLPFVP